MIQLQLLQTAIVPPNLPCSLCSNRINVSNEVATDLVRESRSAVIANLDLYQQVNGCYALPRMRVQEMLEVIDRCIEGIPYVPLDEANAQARGLGNMVAF